VKLRVRFSKLGKVRFTSHRDVARVWERALRRAALPVAYSQGFSPRPRIAFGLALSTGAESVAEYLDIDLDAGALAGEFDVDAVAPQLGAALPDGFEVMAAAVVDPGAVSLQQVVTSCRWVIDLPQVDYQDAQPAVDRLLAAETVVVRRERKGKQVEDDLRPGLLAVEAAPAPPDEGGGGTRLIAELGAQPRALRPSELLDALGFDRDGARVRRTHQWIQDGDARREPLPSTPVADLARDASRDSRREATDVRPRGERPPVRSAVTAGGAGPADTAGGAGPADTAGGTGPAGTAARADAAGTAARADAGSTTGGAGPARTDHTGGAGPGHALVGR
jgi:radical SAM-linked protein